MAAVIDEREEKRNAFAVRGDYTPQEIGDALARVDYYGGNVLRAAQESGIPQSTLRYWLKNQDRLPSSVVKCRDDKKVELAELAEESAQWIGSSITEADITAASLRDKSIAFGVFVDKAQMLRGEPTQVVELKLVRETYTELRVKYELSPDEAKAKVAEAFRLPASSLGDLEEDVKQSSNVQL